MKIGRYGVDCLCKGLTDGGNDRQGVKQSTGHWPLHLSIFAGVRVSVVPVFPHLLQHRMFILQ